MANLLRIGAVAGRCGVSADTIRHYERLGLLPVALRTPAGYRQYPESVCRRVRVVRGALRLGFTLRELAGVMAIRERGEAPCHEVRRLARNRLAHVDAEIRALLQSRRRLKVALKDWDARLEGIEPGRRAHLLEALVPEE